MSARRWGGGLARALWSAALLVGCASPSFAGATYAERVRERELPNGLRVLVLEDHKAPVAVLQLWYRVGSRNERPGYTGLSHLLEHMMFQGTKKLGPEEYSRIVRRNGGEDNAFTMRDATVYFASIASDRYDVVLSMEADRMRHLLLREEAFETERSVVEEERRLRNEDRPAAELFELLSATAYLAHPYQWPVIGWRDDIGKATVEDLREYYRSYYGPANAFLVVVGDVRADDVFRKVRRLFGRLEGPEEVPPVRAVEPPQEGERRVELGRPAELPYVAVAYHVPNALHEDSAALEVLAAILAQGKSSRLYDRLVYRKRKALFATASYDRTSLDPGLFVLHAQPLPGVPVAELERHLLAEVARLREEQVGEEELERAKTALEADFVFAQDSLFYQAMLLGEHELLGDWRLLDRYLPAVRAVDAEDVREVARRYLVRKNRTVGVLSPERTGKAPAAPKPHGAGAERPVTVVRRSDVRERDR